MLGNAYKDYRQERIIWNIHYDLPKHIYIADVCLEHEFMEIEDTAKGIIVKKHFICPAHCAVYENTNNTSFMISLDPGKFIKREIKLGEYLLKEVYFNKEEDIAVYKLPEELNVPDFPCAVKEALDLGEKIFVLGNPLSAGLNIRQGNVSSIIGLKYKKNIHTANTFSVSITGYPGDSGSPVISADYKLIGIVIASFGPGVVCVKYIKKFMDHIK